MQQFPYFQAGLRVIHPRQRRGSCIHYLHPPATRFSVLPCPGCNAAGVRLVGSLLRGAWGAANIGRQQPSTECFWQTPQAESLLPSSQKIGTFNEVICERGLAKGKTPTPHLSNSETRVLSTTHMAPWVRVKFEKLQRSSSLPSQTLVSCPGKQGFSFSLFPGAEIQITFSCFGLGKSGAPDSITMASASRL